MATITDLVPGLSIDALLQRRDDMVARIKSAHTLLNEADQLAEALFGEENRGHRLDLMTSGSRRSFTCPGGDEELIREIDGRAWSYLLQQSGLQTFLDAAAREKWRTAIDKNDVPPLTRANIEGTFTHLYETRGEMFERGVLAVFRALSWEYKTNTPVRFGKRLILDRIIEVWGDRKSPYLSVAHGGADKLDDLIRVLSVLEGKPEPDHRQGTYHKLTALDWPKATKDADLGYFTVRGFKNGNGHLTFTCPALVDQLNKILAKHHPNALPEAR
jgi:hypothetical protein